VGKREKYRVETDEGTEQEGSRRIRMGKSEDVQEECM
jgi:hypothetical protein